MNIRHSQPHLKGNMYIPIKFSMDMTEQVNDMRLSQLISHALRHHPDRYFIELDEEGYTPLKGLAEGLSKQLGYLLPLEKVTDVILIEGQERFEIVGEQVRARYGHTHPVSVERLPAQPPTFLYHGTLANHLAGIKEKGLLKHNLHYVHLSATKEYAEEAGGRRGEAVILTVKALEAHEFGAIFFQASSGIWLVEHVPSKFIVFP